MTRRVALSAAVALCSMLGGVSAACASTGLALGFNDDASFVSLQGEGRQIALARAKDQGSTYVRFFVTWASVAPTEPPSLDAARDPGWSGYRWGSIDGAVRDIVAAGLKPVPVLFYAPPWAEGSGRPSVSDRAPAGTWKPSPKAFGAFAEAAARRYAGQVRDWQAWNEPNLTTYLAPQWRRTSSGYTPASPAFYRRMLNEFYRAVKRVDPANLVITAGSAPFGDLHDGDPRMPPARFWRTLLCVRAGPHPRHTSKCAGTVWFDALAHHPYPIGPPRRHARNADDVVVPDFAKITRPLTVALKAGTVKPHKAKQIWATEISWDSRPDPDGLSLTDQATYLEGALYVLWHQGVDVVTWFLMRDQAPTPSFATTYQSGVYFRGDTVADDKPKPSITAFRFPFTAYRVGGVARLWGLAPVAGEVTVEAEVGSGWKRVATLRAGANRLFTGRLRVGRGTVLRARNGTETSLSWTVI